MRIGAIAYTNCRPYNEAFVRGAVPVPGEIVWGMPNEIGEGLVEGRLEIGPVPTVTWARHHGDLLLIPGLAIASFGPVRSILLLSRVPWEDLSGETIAVSEHSTTSVVLLEVLSRMRGIEIETDPSPPSPGEMLARRKACLLIGDPALSAASKGPTEGTFIHDLGAEWNEARGLPMVYAVWAIRRAAAEEDEEGALRAVNLIREALAWGDANSDMIADSSPHDPRLVADYLEALRAARGRVDLYDGISAFLDEARRLGGVAANPAPEFFG